LPQDSRSKAPVPAASFEASVRQLIANGKFKTALENAKEFHKAAHTSASECLLLDAYVARIQSLLDQNLTVEAKSLLDLVGERFPGAKERMESLRMGTSASGGDLSGLLQPLNDPDLTAERRAVIEQAIQSRITDLGALADCPALPPEHSLRVVAAALDRAFDAVTSGPVTDEQIALTEVSHRSPLAPWKLLIRAIACLHRGEDDSCREYLGAIKPESVPSRLVPAMRIVAGEKTTGEKAGSGLRPAETTLISRVGVNLSELRGTLSNLDRAFKEEENASLVYKAVRTAVQTCQRSAPELLGRLKQIIAVRGGVAYLDYDRLTAALEGGVRRDAEFLRMYARALEGSGDAEEVAEACEVWDEFRQQAVREGRFPNNGVEVATLYLHMADVLTQLPREKLRRILPFGGGGLKPAEGEDRYFLDPERLYGRACAIDPHGDAFADWMRWAKRQSVMRAENVAQAWNRAIPNDIEPLLYLMQEAEKRSAFPTALSYLGKAERIDAVNSVVRAARLRLLAAATMRHLQQKKPHLAKEKLAKMAALPQSRQGERPAFLAALRHLICAMSGDKEGAAAARLEADTLLGSSLAAGFLLFGVGAVSKQLDSVDLPRLQELSKQERAAIPAALARVMALAKDLGITKFQLPVTYFDETEKQFPAVRDSLDTEQIRSLGELGMATEHPRLAWAASGAGLARGGPLEAHFLLLRARALPGGDGERYVVLAAAAAELGRFHRDMEVVDRAVEIVRNPFGGESVSVTLEQAREVVRRELAAPAFPGPFDPGLDYSDFFPEELCQCADCRRRRGEDFDPLDVNENPFGMDEAEMERIFFSRVPKAIPPEVARAMFEVMKEAFLNGEDPGEIMSQFMGGPAGGTSHKKGRRK
jgi:hypothetical protein